MQVWKRSAHHMEVPREPIVEGPVRMYRPRCLGQVVLEGRGEIVRVASSFLLALLSRPKGKENRKDAHLK